MDLEAGRLLNDGKERRPEQYAVVRVVMSSSLTVACTANPHDKSPEKVVLSECRQNFT